MKLRGYLRGLSFLSLVVSVLVPVQFRHKVDENVEKPSEIHCGAW